METSKLISLAVGNAILIYKQLQLVRRNKKSFAELAIHLKDVTEVLEILEKQGVEEGVVKKGLEMFERAVNSANKLLRNYGRINVYMRCIKAGGMNSGFERANKQLNEAKQHLTLALLVEQRQQRQEEEWNISPDQFVKLISCLCEIKDLLQPNELQGFLEKSTEIELSSDHCSNLTDVLLKSEEVLDEFDIDKYDTTDDGRQRLIPVVKCCKKARQVSD